MGNGCNYWMAYLPDYTPHTFLLFVADPQGRTSLRDYSQGRMWKLDSAPGLQDAMRRTDEGRSRFAMQEIRRKEDISFWQAITQEHNRRFLALASQGKVTTAGHEVPVSKTASRERRLRGRVARGSRGQLQDYVNQFPEELNQAVLARMPEALRDRSIRWLSPLADEDYREYQDCEFLERIGLGAFMPQLAEFWPQYGPCWDGLGLIEPRNAFEYPVILLVEAKSHVPEIRSQGCQASEVSLAKIRRAMKEAKAWCGAEQVADWTGPLYQSANRIAHLYFIRQRLNRPCFLLNLYFVADPYRPTSPAEWNEALLAVHRELGIGTHVPGFLEVFVPGKPVKDEKHESLTDEKFVTGAEQRSPVEQAERFEKKETDSSQSKIKATPANFVAWRDHWETLASFEGAHLPDPESRIEQVLAFWPQPIPGPWQRGSDAHKWIEGPYRRSDHNAPHAGEHFIERSSLAQDSRLRRWGLELASRGGKNGKKRAVIAVARKLAVLLHKLWSTGQVYEPMYGVTQAA